MYQVPQNLSLARQKLCLSSSEDHRHIHGELVRDIVAGQRSPFSCLIVGGQYQSVKAKISVPIIEICHSCTNKIDSKKPDVKPTSHGLTSVLEMAFTGE
jgi:hypothetical protein